MVFLCWGWCIWETGDLQLWCMALRKHHAALLEEGALSWDSQLFWEAELWKCSFCETVHHDGKTHFSIAWPKIKCFRSIRHYDSAKSEIANRLLSSGNKRIGNKKIFDKLLFLFSLPSVYVNVFVFNQDYSKNPPRTHHWFLFFLQATLLVAELWPSAQA